MVTAMLWLLSGATLVLVYLLAKALNERDLARLQRDTLRLAREHETAVRHVEDGHAADCAYLAKIYPGCDCGALS